ncbi:MAG: undecaprenyl-diphosphate phosphatase [Deltaproteobacteria bacterium]|nr:undecaprenyl-diphosphate phosphatase [Deltaproteobacteria bacterium]
MDLSTAAILGIVEGVSEFLPISSTGHLILASHLLGLPPTDFLKSFEIAIQVGAILSVLVLYWRELLVNPAVMKRVALAFVPTGLIGLTLYKIIKSYLLGSPSVVLWALAAGGLFLILFEYRHREKDDAVARPEDISYRQALIIGLFQAIAVIPGISRSASTIVGGLVLGLKRKTIVEFSFLLAVPTMAAATGYDLLKNAAQFSLDQVQFLAVGFVMSFVVALLSIKFLLRFIQTHTFIPFGIYRIVLVVLWISFLL